MVKWSAYTLVELIVVVAIIGLLASFGIPAFSKYGRVSDAEQKTLEIKELVTQARSLAQNPENSLVESYRIYYYDYLNTSPNQDKYILSSCANSTCATPVSIREASLIKDQKIEGLTGGNSTTDWLLKCSTAMVDGKVNCQQNDSILGTDDPFEFTVLADHNSNIEKYIRFQISLDPFKIEASKVGF